MTRAARIATWIVTLVLAAIPLGLLHHALGIPLEYRTLLGVVEGFLITMLFMAKGWLPL